MMAEVQEAPDSTQSQPIDLGEAVTFRESVAVGDGYLELTIAENGMAATADLHPPVGEGSPLSLDQAEILFARLGIAAGIDREGLGEAILRCNLERSVQRGIVVARGKEAVAIVAEHALVEEKFRQKPEAVPEDALTYDFRERQKLLVVKKGETLARIIPASAGEEGFDIRGSVLPAPRLSVKSVVPGKNTALEDGRIVALVDGLLAPIPEEGGGKLDVEEILLVRGDVDYHTGHIVFPGDVIIEGSVRDGFKVWSGGSIHCKTTMDAFDVNAKKDLVCDQGIIGRRKAQIRVGGELRAKFIQNCKVAARGDIHVQTAIAGSRVYSLGKIDLGDKGVFMGGEAFAVHGFRAARLGNQAHQSTIIHAGTDFTVQQRLDQANERLRLLVLGVQKAREEAGPAPGKAFDALLARSNQAEMALHELIGRLLQGLDADENAIIEITGEILPGTVIDICRVTIVVDRPLSACRFRLDKAAGRIVTEKATRGTQAAKPATLPAKPAAPAIPPRQAAPSADPQAETASAQRNAEGKK
jgi:uncharacterized protein (DUF342 family)